MVHDHVYVVYKMFLCNDDESSHTCFCSIRVIGRVTDDVLYHFLLLPSHEQY
jgi:hypothetical protein